MGEEREPERRDTGDGGRVPEPGWHLKLGHADPWRIGEERRETDPENGTDD